MTFYVNIPLSQKNYQRIQRWAQTRQQNVVEFITERAGNWESTQHIESTPDIRGGKPRLSGTRVTVSDIVVMHLKMGQSVPEIAGEYDLSLTAVYAALTYYYDNKKKIDLQLMKDETFTAAFQQQNPSPLQTRLRQLHGS